MSTYATDEAPQISGDDERERTRQRHARESAAKAAAMYGISRESVRQAKLVNRLAPELGREVRDGRLSVNAAYAAVVGDDRRPLYLKLDRETDDHLCHRAEAEGVSRQEIVRGLIEIFLYHDG